MSRLLSPARFSIVLAATLFALWLPARAQHDTRGRNFWVTFMSNLGSQPGERSDLRLYLSAETPTTAYVISFKTNDTMLVEIPTARKTVEVNISTMFGADVELEDFEEFAPKAIQVVSDDDITCYGVNIRDRSADAFLGLPDDVLTNSYIVLAYPNAWQGDETQYPWGGSYDQPSQFAIVGTEDGTTVRIDPAAQLNGRKQEVFTITLDRGQVFNGQAVVDRYQDVSGTEIRSNKPVAVFAGNKRTAIPLRIGNFRDHLVEQIPPLEVWGKEAILTPHYTITEESDDIAVARVLAAFDNTKWQINGVEQTPLERTVSVEFPLVDATYITADKPILVAQYEHSVSKYDQNGPGGVALPGDPFMMIVPPTEQFFDNYSFQSVAHPEFHDFGHFINVVIPTPAIPSLLIDGMTYPADWLPTPKPGFSYAMIQVEPGSHNIEADSAFGIYAYGFGSASSYGYPGGMLFKTLVHDFEPPDISQTPACASATGYAFDSRITDGGVDSLYALPATRNVEVTVEPFAPGADTVRYQGVLVDPYQDGVISMRAIDSAGRSRTQTHPIPGFTVHTVGAPTRDPLVVDTLRLFNNGAGCQTIVVENTGAFPQTIRGLDLSPTLVGVGFDTPMPVTIAPGERTSIRFCAQGLSDTVIDVAVTVVGECASRPVAIIPILGGLDTTAPSVASSGAVCNSEISVVVSEPSARVSRIGDVEFDELTNATIVSQTPADEAFPTTRVEVLLRPIDPYRDVIYQVSVVDIAGNAAIFRDTVGGFTVAVLDDARDSVSERFGRDLRVARLEPGDERCDSVLLVNYGARPLTLSTLRFTGNRGYSVPPAQLPFVIPPFSQRRLAVCIESAPTSLIRDTLILEDGCGRSDRLVLKAAVPSITSADICNNALSITSLGAAKRSFLETPFPNPASGSSATVDVGLAADATVSIELLDATGTTSAVVMQQNPMDAGLHRIAFDISSLGNGTYFCRLRTAAGEVQIEKMIIAR